MICKTCWLVARVCCDCWDRGCRRHLETRARPADQTPRRACTYALNHQPQTAASHNQTSCFSFSSFFSSSFPSSSSSFSYSSPHCFSSPLQRPPPFASCSSANAIRAPPTPTPTQPTHQWRQITVAMKFIKLYLPLQRPKDNFFRTKIQSWNLNCVNFSDPT